MDSGGESGKVKICPRRFITRLCYSGRSVGDQLLSRSRESKRRSAGAEDPSPPSTVMGGSFPHSKFPSDAARHGEGCEFFRFQESCLRSQRRRRTLSVSERGRRSAIRIALSVPTLVTMRPRSKRYARRPRNLQGSETRQP